MSRPHHQGNLTNGVSEVYLKTVLGPLNRCPRSQCHGTLVEVLSRYENKGPLNREKECTDCGKVIKDAKYKLIRQQRWMANQKRIQQRAAR